VRGRGFYLPAAGKTGTSHDGWFAGFTSNLICVVWVGFDDNRQLNLEGAKSALPVWTEFMKRAHQFREYRNVKPFTAPEGIVSVEVDPATGFLAAPQCPQARSEVFISGTQPVEVCPIHGGGGGTRVAGWDTTAPGTAPQQPSPQSASGEMRRPAARPPESSVQIPQPQTPQQPPEPPKKKGFFDKLRGIFK
jgi:penicillin-binding protein 1B